MATFLLRGLSRCCCLGSLPGRLFCSLAFLLLFAAYWLLSVPSNAVTVAPSSSLLILEGPSAVALARCFWCWPCKYSSDARPCAIRCRFSTPPRANQLPILCFGPLVSCKVLRTPFSFTVCCLRFSHFALVTWDIAFSPRICHLDRRVSTPRWSAYKCPLVNFLPLPSVLLPPCFSPWLCRLVVAPGASPAMAAVGTCCPSSSFITALHLLRFTLLPLNIRIP